MTDLFAARSQMALSLGFHMIFATLGIGMPLFMVVAEGLWLRTGDQTWLKLAKAWAKGAVLNMGTPSAILSPVVNRLEHTSFYDSTSAGMLARIQNMLTDKSGNLNAYGLVFILSTIGLVMWSLLSLTGAAGALAADRESRLKALLLILWCLMILVINGPVGTPKYRLPVEPALVIFAALGLRMLIHRRRTGDLRP